MELWSVVLRLEMCMHCVGIFVITFYLGARAAVLNGAVSTIQDYPQTVEYGACVGTLISSSWILSAAHCYDSEASTVKILSLPLKQQTKSIKRQVVHPRFKLGTNYVNKTKSEIYAVFDYLLLELNTSLRSVKYLKLSDAPEPMPGTKVRYPSVDSFDHANFYAELYYGELFTLSDTECAKRVQNFDPSNMLCAVGGAPLHTGACFGDSGSGLVANGRLLGVVSWVEKDARDCGPGRVVVAARLSTPAIKKWIRRYVPK